MKIQKIIGAGAIGLASIVAAYAHGGATGIVKERMEAMGTMSDVGEALTGLFPEGSGGEPSEAKAEVWSNWDEFSALAAQLETLSEGLGLAADNGLMSGSGGQAQGGMMGGGTGMMGSANTMMGGTAPMMGRGGSFDAAVLAAMPADGARPRFTPGRSADRSR